MFLINPELPVNPQKDYDEGPDKWKKQEKLEVFRKKISQDQLPAIFNETNLSGIISDSLYKWREEKEGVTEKEKPPQKEEPIPNPVKDLEKEISSYCKKAASLHEHLPVAGFATQITVPIDLEDMYVPLRAMVNLQGVREKQYLGAEDAEKYLNERDCGSEISLVEAFHESKKRKRRGIVILDDPVDPNVPSEPACRTCARLETV